MTADTDRGMTALLAARSADLPEFAARGLTALITEGKSWRRTPHADSEYRDRFDVEVKAAARPEALRAKGCLEKSKASAVIADAYVLNLELTHAAALKRTTGVESAAAAVPCTCGIPAGPHFSDLRDDLHLPGPAFEQKLEVGTRLAAEAGLLVQRAAIAAHQAGVI